ncbi:MAG: putative circadian clock protein KaiC [Frankiales bacterium]|nr:putative circadian clock protein KaiC [Frankiales bacterium]
MTSEPEQPQSVRRAREADAAAVHVDLRGDIPGIDKLETGIPGFDHVTMGGLPRRRATVVAGQSGSAKTVFAGHFLAEGVRRGQPAVFVTLEEPAGDLRTNLTTLGFDIAGWEEQDDWRFVDASPLLREDGTTLPYSFSALAAQIGAAVDATGAERIVLDSLNTALSLAPDAAAARQQLRGLVSGLRASGLSVVMTVETPADPSGSLSRFGIEEFVADNVVLLRNTREGKVRRRTLEVLKMRGAAHRKGDYAFTVLPGVGLVVLPVATSAMAAGRASERVGSGVPDLDALCGGGLLRDSITLVAGPTGTGKTLMSLEFLAEAAQRGERGLLLGYEESPEQIARNAVGRGREFDRLRERGDLRVVSTYPEEASLEEHLLEIKQLIDDFGPTRLVVDSLSALERAGSPAAYREFVVGLTSYAKQRNLTTFLTASTPGLDPRDSLTVGHVSTLADSVVLLRYAEDRGRIARALTVLKMRGSDHDRGIHELAIDDDGLHLGKQVDSHTGIVLGALVAPPAAPNHQDPAG